MSTTGTFGFAPSTGELVMQAFRRIGKSRAELTAEMLFDARQELNLIGSAWANRGPNLWAVDQIAVPLIAGQAAYAIDPATVDILDARITVPGPADQVLAPISRGDYAAYPNKAQTGRPTVFWLDRLAQPVLTLWPVPDANGPYVLSFFRARQMQDATLGGATTPDVPYRGLDALCWALAENLSYLYAPDRTAIVGAKAQAALAEMRDEDVEDAPMVFAPSLRGYYR